MIKKEVFYLLILYSVLVFKDFDENINVIGLF